MSTYAEGKVTVVVLTIPERSDMRVRAVGSVLAQEVVPDRLILAMDWERRGSIEMRNRVLGEVVTEWTAFLDDDDELLPHHLAVLMERARRFAPGEGPDLYYPWFEMVGIPDPLSVPRDGRMVSPFGVPFGEEQKRHILEVDNFIPVTVMARTERMIAAGGLQSPGSPPTPVYDRDDLGLWRAMLRAGCNFEHVPVVTWRYHHHPGHTGGLRAGEPSWGY